MEQESKAVELIYQDTEIHNLFSEDDKVMVNATEMAKVFGKRLDHFTKSDHTKDFLKAIKLPPFGVSLGIKSDKDLIDYKGRNGTYFHRVLALKFAAWLDPMFEVWIYSKIEEVLFGKAKIAGQKISEVSIQEAKIKKLREDILLKGSDDAKKLLEEEANLVEMKKNKNKAVSVFVKSNQPELPFD